MGTGLFLILLCCLTLPAGAVASPFDIDLKELEATRKRVSPPPTAPPSAPRTAPRHTPPRQEGGGGWVSYTIRPGDHLFRILMTHFGYTNAEAERIIPQVLEKNGITDIRRLTVGKSILVPPKGTVTPRPTPPPRHSVRRPMPPATATEEAPSPPPEPKTEPAPAPPQQDVVPPPASPEPAPSPMTAASPTEHPTPPDRPTVASPPPTPSPPPPLTPVGPLIVMPVTATDAGGIVLGIADALQLVVEKNVIIETEQKDGGFSIKVPLTLEGNGRTIVVGGTSGDPFQYTLFRLLERSGQTVLLLSGKERFPELARRVIEGIGLPVREGHFVLTGGAREEEVDGFLIETAGGRMLITDRPIAGIRNAAERPSP